MKREVLVEPLPEEVLDLAAVSAEPEERLEASFLSDDPIKDYLRNIGKVSLLDAEQEIELAKRIEAGKYAENLLARSAKDGELETAKWSSEELEWLASDGDAAKQHFIAANTRLVVSVARKYQNRGLNFMDLIQEGNLGLIRAVEKFDYTKGYKFSTYGSWWIRQSITRGIAEQARTIRVPVHTYEEISKMRAVGRDLEKSGIAVTPENLAKELKIPVERVQDLEMWSRDPISLDTPIGEDSDNTIASMLSMSEDGIEEAVEFKELREKIEEAFLVLDDREQIILKMLFGLKDGKQHTYKDIGAVIGVSLERTRQLTKTALDKLKQGNMLEDYVDASA